MRNLVRGTFFFFSLFHSIRCHRRATDCTLFWISFSENNQPSQLCVCFKLSGKLFLSQHWGHSGKMWEKTNYHVRKTLKSCLVSGECLQGNAAPYLPPCPWKWGKSWIFFNWTENYTLIPFSFPYSSCCITWNLLGGGFFDEKETCSRPR